MISYSPSSAPRQFWLILSAIAAGLGLLTGAPPTLVLGALGILWLPVLAGYMPQRMSRESEGFQVLGWTVVAAISIALSGGASSSLTILFALGPLTGLALGRRKVAVEAAVFSALAFFSFWAMDFWISTPQLPENLLGLASALTLAAIIYAGILAAVAIVNLRRRIASEYAMQAKSQETEPSVSPRGGVKLPEDFPVAVVSVAPEGRIRAIEGDREMVAPLRVGDLAAEALSALAPELGSDFLRTAGEVELELKGVGPVQVRSVASASGVTLVLSRTGDGQGNLESALQERTAFFASLGHDLKTPLNAIIGFADMMRSGLRGPLPDAYREYSDIIHDSGQDLLLLVDDILDLAKADAKKLNLDMEPVDLCASGASVMRQLSAQAERSEVALKLETDEEVWAEADARAVRQIWQNLVSNAIKYSSSGEEVILRTGAHNDLVFLSVEDFGAGMDQQDLERISQPFQQGRNARGHAGTGLGLAVVKQFADLHGGQVKIETARGQGTRVEVTFKPADVSGLDDLETAAQ